jgi:hypothetical protein
MPIVETKPKMPAFIPKLNLSKSPEIQPPQIYGTPVHDEPAAALKQ